MDERTAHLRGHVSKQVHTATYIFSVIRRRKRGATADGSKLVKDIRLCFLRGCRRQHTLQVLSGRVPKDGGQGLIHASRSFVLALSALKRYCACVTGETAGKTTAVHMFVRVSESAEK